MLFNSAVDVQHHQPIIERLVKLPTKALLITLFKTFKRHFIILKCLFFVCFSSFNLFLFSLILFTPLSAIASSPDNTSCFSSQEQLNHVLEWNQLKTIVDGDTIHLRNGKKIRLIGINTPEIGHNGKASQPFAQKAKQALKNILKKDQKIGLYYDKEKHDKYKRILAFAILEDGRNIAEILLSQGLAHSIVVPPNDKHIHCLRQIEHSARQLNLGLWQLAENKTHSAAELPIKTKGYRFLSGKISAYNESKKSIYLKLTKKLSIRIAKKDMQYFPDINLKSLIGEKVLLRGWVNSYRGRQSIHIRSAYDLRIRS